MNEIKITINDNEVIINSNESVLQSALKNGIDIPHFCHHDDLPTEARCRTCLVEVEETGKVLTSCDLKPEEGMRIRTDTAKVDALRKTNLELLLAGHRENCSKCRQGLHCKVAETAEKFGVTMQKYNRPKINAEVHKMCQAAEVDPQLCIACNKCVEICDKIGIGFLEMKDKNTQTHAGVVDDPNVDCIYCGQCTVHCPVGSAREHNEIEVVEQALADEDKIVIAQMAPSVRASIGEEFGMAIGEDLTKKCYTAFRVLGFDKVFDVNMGADITTVVEASELKERILENRDLPMFTSCCPAWVKFIEFYYPDMLKHLTTARSPQIHSGGAYKTWWAERENIDPSKIFVISFMPCTSKKYEAKHDKLKINGMYPVDSVLTTREMATLLKKRNIDLPNLEPSEADDLGLHSGAGAIYGASGGVMESALRTAYHDITGKELEKVEFESVRGIEGIKRAEIDLDGRKLKVAVVATAKNAHKIMEEIKKDKTTYDYIEIMGCPGGCIGGGGQPIPTTMEIVQKRINSLYNIDSKMELRKAHLNPVVREFFDNYISKLTEEDKKNILETNYAPKKRFE